MPTSKGAVKIKGAYMGEVFRVILPYSKGSINFMVNKVQRPFLDEPCGKFYLAFRIRKANGSSGKKKV
jgi:hypothetical protein